MGGPASEIICQQNEVLVNMRMKNNNNYKKQKEKAKTNTNHKCRKRITKIQKWRRSCSLKFSAASLQQTNCYWLKKNFWIKLWWRKPQTTIAGSMLIWNEIRISNGSKQWLFRVHFFPIKSVGSLIFWRKESWSPQSKSQWTSTNH